MMTMPTQPSRTFQAKRSKSLTISMGIALISSVFSSANADTPLGWIESAAPSAYTLGAMEIDLSLGAVVVNDTVDFLNIRDDLLAGTRKLEGNSGDLSGQNFSVQFGIASMLTAFYSQQDQDFTVELGNIASINLLALDSELSTTSKRYGLKWNIYEAGHRSEDRAWHAMSLELSRLENSSDNFEGTLDQIFLNDNTTITFNQPQTFSMARMEDEALQAKVLYSWPMTRSVTSTVWLSYTDVQSSAGTTSDIAASSLADAFEQSFDIDEKRVQFGLGLNWQITPRMPLQLSYEFINVTNSDATVVSNPANVLLPTFLRASNISQQTSDTNHIFKGSLSYWVTPKVNVSAYGTVFSNQFLGVIPHFNNPMTSSFSDNPYGYVGLSIGLRI